ncbi:MAG: enoyl-CoA hydratase [Cognatishimia sp.]|uniref:enoyl-CoA hydratase n=1 Tax=Cognatishimia sp. TaxID=2211648 RepID=UPI003B8DE6AF
MAILERYDTQAIARLTLNAPERLNSLSDEMMAALQAELEAIAKDASIRAVILSGAGKAFCAGHDLKQMTAGRAAEDGGKSYFADLFARCSALMLTIQSIPQPVIAEVHGIATAAGCQLVATCDLAIAADDTRFGVNGINIGLFCATPMVALTRNIPRKKAFEMLTTGQFIHADEAERIGLINAAVPADQLRSETEALAQKLVEKLKAVVKIGKEAFYTQSTMTTAEAYDYAADVMVQNMLFKDTEEGISAFLGKRAPNWQQ